MHDHTLQERNPAIWSQQNRKTGTQNTFVLSVKPSVFKGCRGRAIFYYPIWWGEAPKIINTFLESYSFEGKTIIPFCTSGSSGIGSSAENLHAVVSDEAEWLSGTRFSGNTSKENVAEWIQSIDIDIK